MRLLLCALALSLPARAQGSARPRNNGSYVPADNAAIANLVLEARRAAESGDREVAADRLQALLLTRERGLVALKERLLYVSARRWAQIQLLSETAPFGREVLEAWRDVQDADADAALAAAIASNDVEELRRLVERAPAATAAPTALFALTDRALQRGDPDAARGYLLAIPEHVARSEEEALLASEAYRRRRAHLMGMASRRPQGWPTLGGDMTRMRTGDPLPPPGKLGVVWETAFLEQVPPTLHWSERDDTREHSPLLPFYPVCDAENLYVHLGPVVAALSRASGKLLFYAPEGSEPDEDRIDEMLARSPGVRAATVVDGVLYFNRVLFDGDARPQLHNALVAFDVKTRRTLWEVRPGEGKADRKILNRALFFRGAPAVVGERLYVYAGVRDVGDDGATRKEEAHVLCFDRRRGTLLWRRFLGYGDTDASPQFPPLGGLAPAVSAGVVVAATGLGVAAALDARTGDVLWLFRYDRSPVRERERLAEIGEERKVHLRSGWMREPPRIVGDTVYFAAFDADELYACWLRGMRQPTQVFEIEQWSKHRSRGHRHSLLEYVAGTAGGRLFYVGRRDPRPSVTVSYQAVVSHPLNRTVDLGYGLIPHLARAPGGRRAVPPEIYGRPTIAGPTLLVPTKEAVFRFDVGRQPRSVLRDGERHTEIPPLPPYLAPPREVLKGEERVAAFGNLVAIDGFLYAVTGDRVICYGPVR